MKILAIESSCDETAAAVLDCDSTRLDVQSNCIYSQIDKHALFGGVVPEIASRMHIECIPYVIDSALLEAACTLQDVDAIAVTYAPGLIGALLVGVNYAKTLAYSLNIPLIPVHHIEGHIFANFLSKPDLKPPFICLVASGGHSTIVHIKSFNTFEIAAKTRDDAAGEAFDKIARVLHLGYPGGPAVQNAAKSGNIHAFNFPKVKLENSYDFSFSGVKTKVINEVHKLEQNGKDIPVADIAASFQEAVCEVLAQRVVSIAGNYNINQITLAGGVAANEVLRAKCTKLSKENNIKLSYPPLTLCTDNAAMIGARAYYNYLDGNIAQSDLNAMATKEITVKNSV